LVAELERTAELVERVVARPGSRLCGEVPDGSTRVVSHCRAGHCTGRPDAVEAKPVEFGYKAQVLDTAEWGGLPTTTEWSSTPPIRCAT